MFSGSFVVDKQTESRPDLLSRPDKCNMMEEKRGRQTMYDICIIGAGIIGCFLARDLSRYHLSVLLLEKEADVANGATMANSAIIHAGDDPEDGTLKARFNVRGALMYRDLCRELGVAFLETSALVAATSPEEEATLMLRYERACRRNIPARLLSRSEALEKEPNLSDLVTKAMELPSTGVVCPWEIAIALAEEAVLNGLDLHLEEPVTGIVQLPDAFRITTSRGSYDARSIINCAGVYADRIYAMVSAKTPSFTVIPRRGEYYVIDKLREKVVHRVIYPVPSSVGKGILATPTVDGNLLIGPNALDIDDREGINTTAEGLALVREKIGKTVRNVPFDKMIRQFAGLRAKGNGGDFLVEEAPDVKCFINAACIDSPGLSSAPAISEYILAEMLPRYFSMTVKETFLHRRPTLRLDRMTPAEREDLVRRDPSFAHMICRCEQITEGEILDVIRRPVGARTVKGVKKRARPGMGRCQGGFCELRVMEILSRELGVSRTDIRYDDAESVLLTGLTKADSISGEAGV